MCQHQQGLLETTQPPPRRVQLRPAGVGQPGDALDQVVRDIEHGRTRNQQGVSDAGVMGDVTTPTTRGSESALATWVPDDAGEVKHLVDQLTAADWLTDADLTDPTSPGSGQLTHRVRPLSCPLRASGTSLLGRRHRVEGTPPHRRTRHAVREPRGRHRPCQQRSAHRPRRRPRLPPPLEHRNQHDHQALRPPPPRPRPPPTRNGHSQRRIPPITTELLHEVLSTVPDTWLTNEPGFTTTTDVRNAYITHLTPEPQPPPTGSRPNSPHRPNGQAADEGDALLLAGLRRVRHGSGPGAPVRHPLCSAVLPCG